MKQITKKKYSIKFFKLNKKKINIPFKIQSILFD